MKTCKKITLNTFTFCHLILLLVILQVFNLNAREIPKMSSPIIDEINLTSPSFQSKYSSYLKEIFDKHHLQIQILLLDNLGDESIESFSIKVADSYKLGRHKNEVKGIEQADKGLLFLLSLKEKKMRIEVGRGLEGDITDLFSKRILDQMRPALKNGQYEKAITIFLGSVLQKLNIEADPKYVKPKKRNSTQSLLVYFIIFIFMMLYLIFNILLRPSRLNSYGHYGGGYGGFGGSGHSSGGGWSSGGGSFGGGGASSDF